MNTNSFETNIKGSMPVIDNVTFYQNKAPESAVLPYVVLRFDTTVDVDPTYLTNLIFACFDSQNKKSKDIKNIADSIQNTFNKKVLVYKDMVVHSTMTIRQEIPSEMLTEKQGVELQFDLILYSNKEVI